MSQKTQNVFGINLSHHEAREPMCSLSGKKGCGPRLRFVVIILTTRFYGET